MDTDEAAKVSKSNAEPSISTLPEAEAYATLLVTQYLVDQKKCSEVGVASCLIVHIAQLLLMCASLTSQNLTCDHVWQCRPKHLPQLL